MKRISGSAFLLGWFAISGLGCFPGHSDHPMHGSSSSAVPYAVRPGLGRHDRDDYVGSRRCAQCHDSIYRNWTESVHARSLTAEDYQSPPHRGSCRRCHTTGRGTENGVGCEACHGPQRMHADNPERTSPDPCVICTVQKQCIQCHNRSVDPEFSASDDWKRVTHGTE